MRKSHWFYLFFTVLTTISKSAIVATFEDRLHRLGQNESFMDLIIDGYNLIGANQGLSGALEHKRNRLLQQISAYQRRKRFNLVVVFDGWRSGQPQQAQGKYDDVTVVFSRLGEKADSVIIRLAREKGSGCVVVTSDREIGRAVQRFGAVAVYAGEFNEILRSLERGSDENDFDDEAGESSVSYSRNRLRKSDRKRQEKLRKLYP